MACQKQAEAVEEKNPEWTFVTLLGRFSKVAAAQTLIPFIKKLFICQFFCFAPLPVVFLPFLPCFPRTLQTLQLLGCHKDKLDALVGPASVHPFARRDKATEREKKIIQLPQNSTVHHQSHNEVVQLLKMLVTFKFMACPSQETTVRGMAKLSKLIKFPSRSTWYAK